MDNKLYFYKCKLIRVLDGDTIEADIDLGFNIWIKHIVRLHGIQAPEMKTGKPGIDSKMELLRILAGCRNMGDEFYLKTFKDKKGSFGRILAVLKLPEEEMTVNEILVKSNYATLYKKTKMEDLLWIQAD